MSGVATCPALLVSAPASGQGKTTVTAALAQAHRDLGRRVQVFKTGPDFLDPLMLARASGTPVRQLDIWMGGDAHCAALLHRAARQSDLILVEGVMGLHDGTPSSADLALHFGLPVLAVIDASAMAQTFAAVAHGLATWRPGLQMAGVVANRIGGAGHAQMLQASLAGTMTWFGALPHDSAMALPSRHLGLVPAAEVADVDARIARATQALAASVRLAGADGLPLPPAVRFDPVDEAPVQRLLSGVRVAVARDAAFSFLYPANLDTLQALGAEACFFSPLADEPVPPGAHALWLPGGYPELHLDRLANAARCRASIQAHQGAGRPLLAECGGLLALLQTLTDTQGRSAPMFGVLPGHGQLTDRFVNLGLQSLLLPEGELRGHTFHHARIDTPLQPSAMTAARPQHGAPEPVYRQGRVVGSFLHAYFASQPAALAALLRP